MAEFGPGFGSFSAQLTESPNINWSSLAGLSHTGIGEPEVRRCLVKSKFGFDMLFGPQNPDEVKELSTDHARVIVMRLARASGNVLLDLGRSLSTTASMLGLCGRIVVVTDRDPCAVASARVTLRALKAAGVSDEKVSVVVVDRTPLLQASSPQEIEAMLRCSIPGCLPYVGESFYPRYS